MGANLQKNEAGEVALTPIADMPAEKAGVQKGDVLIAVDGKTITKEMTIEQIIALVRGQINTNVTLSVQRKSEKLDFTITRQRIEATFGVVACAGKRFDHRLYRRQPLYRENAE